MQAQMQALFHTGSGLSPDAGASWGEHPEQLVEFWLPERSAAPLIILWHGGYWRQGVDRSYLRPLAVALRERGYLVALPEYRRTGGDGGWPATFDDARQAAQQIPTLLGQQHPGAHRAGCVIFSGHSAGGQLAHWLSVRAADFGLTPPTHTITLAPVVNLASAQERGDGEGAVQELLGGSAAEFLDRYQAVDPTMLGRCADATVIVHGTDDIRVPFFESERFCSAFGAELIPVPGANHLDVIDPSRPACHSTLTAFTQRSSA